MFTTPTIELKQCVLFKTWPGRKNKLWIRYKLRKEQDKLDKEQDKLDKEKNREYYPFDEYDDPELIPAIEAGDDDNRDETESQ